jgi:hypothetical protein
MRSGAAGASRCAAVPRNRVRKKLRNWPRKKKKKKKKKFRLPQAAGPMDYQPRRRPRRGCARSLR